MSRVGALHTWHLSGRQTSESILLSPRPAAHGWGPIHLCHPVQRRPLKPPPASLLRKKRHGRGGGHGSLWLCRVATSALSGGIPPSSCATSICWGETPKKTARVAGRPSARDLSTPPRKSQTRTHREPATSEVANARRPGDLVTPSPWWNR